jgi:hypothetical protein
VAPDIYRTETETSLTYQALIGGALHECVVDLADQQLPQAWVCDCSLPHSDHPNGSCTAIEKHVLLTGKRSNTVKRSLAGLGLSPRQWKALEELLTHLMKRINERPRPPAPTTGSDEEMGAHYSVWSELVRAVLSAEKDVVDRWQVALQQEEGEPVAVILEEPPTDGKEALALFIVTLRRDWVEFQATLRGALVKKSDKRVQKAGRDILDGEIII